MSCPSHLYGCYGLSVNDPLSSPHNPTWRMSIQAVINDSTLDMNNTPPTQNVHFMSSHKNNIYIYIINIILYDLKYDKPKL